MIPRFFLLVGRLIGDSCKVFKTLNQIHYDFQTVILAKTGFILVRLS